jgi:putative transposase
MMQRQQRRSAAEWQALIERQAASGLSQEAFCEQEGLVGSTFRRWKGRLAEQAEAGVRRDSARPLFAALTPPPEPSVQGDGGWDIELDLGGGLCLRIRRSGEC